MKLFIRALIVVVFAVAALLGGISAFQLAHEGHWFVGSLFTLLAFGAFVLLAVHLWILADI